MDRIISILAVGLSLFFINTAHAVPPTTTEVAKLVAFDAAPMDYFGKSVAVDGDTALIGAPGDDDLATDSGAAYIYVRDAAGAWSLQQKITVGESLEDDRFGYRVALDGDVAVISMNHWDFFNPVANPAYVFTRDSAGVWTLQQKLTTVTGVTSVAVNGGTIMLGAPGEDDVGATYVYTSDSSGVWSVQQKLVATNGKTGDGFGSAIDVDGDTATIAATGYDYTGAITDSGIVYVFTRDSAAVWTQQQALLPSDPASNSGFSDTLAVSGDTILIGAWADDQIDVNAGAAYLFTRDSAGVWSEQQKFTSSDIAGGDYFGMSVDMEGDNLIVGAYGDDDNGTFSGSVYLFARDTSGVWSEQLKLLASDGIDYDYLGTAAAISGTTVLAGAELGDTAVGTSTGSAYLYDITPGDGPDISLSASSVSFGDVVVGQTEQRVVTVSNYGTAGLSLYGISISSGVDFSQANNCPASLLPSESCQVTVTFAPTLGGPLSDTITILSSDPDESSVDVALSGNGITEAPDLIVTELISPDTLVSATYVTMNVTIANQGLADVAWGHWVSLYLGNTQIASQYVFQLPLAGGELQLSYEVAVPRMPRGTYTLQAVVDSLDEVMELDETNNTLSKSVSVVPN